MGLLDDNPLICVFQQMLEECDYETRPYYSHGNLSKPCLSVEVYTPAAVLNVGVELIDACVQGLSVELNSSGVERLKETSEHICQIIGMADFEQIGDHYVVFFLFIEYKELT